MPTKPGPKKPVKKVDLSDLGAESKSNQADLPDNARTRGLVDAVIATNRVFDAAEEAAKAAKANLTDVAYAFLVETFTNHSNPPSSIRCVGTDDAPVLVCATNKYPLLDADTEKELIKLIGADLVKGQFEQGYKISISGDKIPMEKAKDFIAKFKELVKEFGVKSALKVESGVKPRKTFHTDRFTVLPKNLNQALQGTKAEPGICPMQLSVKVVGVKEDDNA